MKGQKTLQDDHSGCEREIGKERREYKKASVKLNACIHHRITGNKPW